MKFDLYKPCKNCPFRTDETRIKFACVERAEEIDEQAYRNGFPCHLSADYMEDDGSGKDGFIEGDNSQHCVGYLIMMMKSGETEWPGVDNDSALISRLWDQVDWKNAPVFECRDDFLDANDKGMGE